MRSSSMLTTSDLEDLRVEFSHDRFEFATGVLRTLIEVGLTIDDLVKGACDKNSHLLGVSKGINRDGDEHDIMVCPRFRPPLRISLWYHRSPPRYVFVEEVSRGE